MNELDEKGLKRELDRLVEGLNHSRIAEAEKAIVAVAQKYGPYGPVVREILAFSYIDNDAKRQVGGTVI